MVHTFGGFIRRCQDVFGNRQQLPNLPWLFRRYFERRIFTYQGFIRRCHAYLSQITTNTDRRVTEYALPEQLNQHLHAANASNTDSRSHKNSNWHSSWLSCLWCGNVIHQERGLGCKQMWLFVVYRDAIPHCPSQQCSAQDKSGWLVSEMPMWWWGYQ